MTALLELVPRWLLLALLVAAGAFAGVQTVRLAGAQTEAAQAREQVASMEADIAQANTEAAQRAAALQSQVLKAQNEAIKREAVLRADIAAARTESDGLRDDAAALRDQLAGATREAAIDRAAAVAAVLSQCAARHQVLAASCDRHVNDLRTLTEAWPR